MSLAVKETRYLMCVRLFTYKAVHEVIIFVGGLLLLGYLIVGTAHTTALVVIGISGILCFILCWAKQGITESGVLLLSRGREYYHWAEIDHIVLFRRTILEVRYYTKTQYLIGKQRYSASQYDALCHMLASSGVPYATAL